MTAKIQVNRLARFTGHKQAVYALTAGRGDALLSAGGDGYVVEWNASNPGDGRVLAQIPAPVYSLACLQESGLILAGTQAGNLFLIGTDERVKNLEAHRAGLFSITAHEKGFITTGGDGMLIYWDAEGRILQRVKVSDKPVRKALWLEETGQWVLASSDFCIHVLDRDWKRLNTLQGHTHSVFALAWLPHIQTLVSGGRDAVLRLWNMPDGKSTGEIAAHIYHIHSLQLSPCGLWFASASMDKTIKIWDARSMELLKVIDFAKFQAHTSSVNSLVWLNQDMLASGSDDRQIFLWQIQG
ncbi:MAG: hypothetical protein JNL57_05185 [Bacteroidetes bacterium]|nr:hypothetical protein [Bacteroidota bacterium]